MLRRTQLLSGLQTGVSVLRKRAESAFEHFIDVRAKSDAEIADAIRAAEGAGEPPARA